MRRGELGSWVVVWALAFLLAAWTSHAFAAGTCTNDWKASDSGYVGTYGDETQFCAARIATYSGNYVSVSCVAGVYSASEVFDPTAGGSRISVTWTRQGCTPDSGTPASGPMMGDAGTSSGIYVFVVGCCLMFALGVLAGMKR